jgi:hypothetical protein
MTTTGAGDGAGRGGGGKAIALQRKGEDRLTPILEAIIAIAAIIEIGLSLCIETLAPASISRPF